MSFWGKPNIQAMIQKRDTKGLWKACQSNDYSVRKEAMLGLIEINELLPISYLILSLIIDNDVEVRRTAYTYHIFGETGLYSLIAALHDVDSGIRIQALEILHTYHTNKCQQIFERVTQFDPEINVREKAKTIVDSLKINEQIKTSNMNARVNNKYLSWLSNEALFDDLLTLIKKEQGWNPGFKGKSGITFPYSSPLMASCEALFEKAREYIKSDESRAELLLGNVLSRGIEGLNFLSSEVPLSETGKHKQLPYQDYIVCSFIMLARLSNSMGV